MRGRTRFFSTLIALVCLVGSAGAQTATYARPHARVPQTIDEHRTVTLQGNVHPLAAASANSSTVAEDMPMQHMVLSLKSDASQDSVLEQLVAAQNDANSPLFHQFLTPEQFGTQFGVAEADLEKVTSWLQSHGFSVDEIPANHQAVVFSGTAGQVSQAFHTEIRSFSVAGVNHYGNVSDPQIPAALAEVVSGVVKLHNFRHSRSVAKVSPLVSSVANPLMDLNGSHYLVPADYATIYNISPLYTSGVNGAGQTIAVLARSDISLSDVQTFRNFFGLPVNNPQFVITNSDPGVVDGDSLETSLDTEWAGAVAPTATVKVIISASTNTADGIDLSAQYAVNNNVASVITLSYGSCESAMGTAENAFYNALWKQAAAQGISVMVSAGDAGASCGPVRGINGLCSSPYATCVGGTQFLDTSNPGQYWYPGNNATGGSAISYIPEQVWNESGSNGGSGVWAGGGGASMIYSKPSWQTGSGVPADGVRDVPDVSLTASGHDGYLVAAAGNWNAVGGTSASAPSFAGLVALVNQKTSARQGCINPILYPLAVSQAAGGPAIFHDTTVGNNSVPGVTGYSATSGYDLASGLGSVDATSLVNNWMGGIKATLSLTASASTITVNVGQSVQDTITSTASASLKSAVTLSVTGAPAGVTTTLAASTLASPGSGSVALSVAASSSAKPGTYPITVTATGGGQTARVALSLVIATPSFTLTASAATVNATAGKTASVAFTATPAYGFSSTIALSVAGLPAGVTGVFSPASLNGANTASATLGLTLATSVKAGTYPLVITATGGGVTQSSTISLVVVVPSFTLSSSTTLSATAGKTAQLSISTAPQNGFNSTIALSIAGLPSGVTASFSPASLSGASTAASNLLFTLATTTKAGTYPLVITATGGNVTQSSNVSMVVIVPSFTLASNAGTANVYTGATTQLSIVTTPQNGFNSTISLAVSGLPTGVTGAFSPATLNGGSTGASALTLAVANTVKAGTYSLVIIATGGGVTQTANLSLVVAVTPSCTLAANPSAIALVAGQSTSVTVSCGSVQGSFTAPVALSVSTPSGVTAQVAAALTAGSSTNLTIGTGLTTAQGRYTVAVTATAPNFSQALSIPVTVSVPSTFYLTAGANTVTTKTSAPGQVTVTSTHLGAFASAVTLTTAGLPAGVTASYTKSVFTAPGDGSTTVTFTAGSTAKLGSYSVTVVGTGGGITASAPLTLTVAANQDFSFALNTSAITIQQGGGYGPVIVSTGNFTGGFNSTISISFSGLAVGMNWSVLNGNAANNLVNVTEGFNAATYTPVGTYPLTITASGAGVVHSGVVMVTVTASTAQAKK